MSLSTWRNRLATGFLCGAVALPVTVPAQEGTTPLERHPSRLETFATGNTPAPKTFRLRLGTKQVDPRINVPGTGNQVYFAGLAYAPIDGLELGMDYMSFVDPPPKPIAGSGPGSVQVRGPGAYAKVRLYRDERLSVSAQVAAEAIFFKSPIFGTAGGTRRFVGAAHLPISYRVSPDVELHFTPGVTVFPSSINGSRFYGTVASVGAGVTWKPSERTLVYGTATMPLTGANTIFSDGSYGRRPVFSVGGRYNLAPNSALDIYLTNRLGATTSTGVLTHFPGGDFALIGVQLVHTFGKGTPAKGPYNRNPNAYITEDHMSFAGDWVTLPGARAMRRGIGMLQGFASTQGGRGARAQLAIDHFVELGASIELPADDGSGAVNKVFSRSPRWTGHLKLQLLEQIDNHPFTMALDFGVGRDFKDRGVFFAAAPMMREIGPRMAVAVVPKAAFYGNNTELGLGLGANFKVSRAVNLIGEYTLRNNGSHIWAVGARVGIKESPFEIALHATNATGAYGVNSMTSQSDPKIALTVSVFQGLFR